MPVFRKPCAVDGGKTERLPVFEQQTVQSGCASPAELECQDPAGSVPEQHTVQNIALSAGKLHTADKESGTVAESRGNPGRLCLPLSLPVFTLNRKIGNDAALRNREQFDSYRQRRKRDTGFRLCLCKQEGNQPHHLRRFRSARERTGKKQLQLIRRELNFDGLSGKPVYGHRDRFLSCDQIFMRRLLVDHPKNIRRNMRRKRDAEQTVVLAGALFSLLCIAANDYGLRVWLLAAVSFIAALLTELAVLKIRHKKADSRIFRAALNGVILLMLMPVTVPASLLIISCIFGNIIGNFRIKGDRAPVFPAASAGYCLAWLIDRKAVLLFPARKETVSLLNPDRSLLTKGTSALWNQKWLFPSDPVEWLLGVRRMPVGGGSLFLLAVIAVIFLLREISSGNVLFPAVTAMIAANEIFTVMQIPRTAAAAALLTNYYLFSVIFIYSETKFAPPETAGILFGLLTAFFTVWVTRLHPFGDAVMWITLLLGPAAAGLRISMKSEKKKEKAKCRQRKNRHTA